MTTHNSQANQINETQINRLKEKEFVFEARIKEIEIALQDTAAKKQDASNRLEQGKAQINQLMQSQQPPNLG